jgi:hypothetical protein
MGNMIRINKLFLVGNGLDLALGLKTSYTDFMFWLLKKQLLSSCQNYKRQRAPSEYHVKSVSGGLMHALTIYGLSTHNLFDVLIKENYGKEKLVEAFDNFNDLEDIFDFLGRTEVEIELKNRFGLFREIYKQSNAGWVDIEETYFQILKQILYDKRNHSISVLNDELEILSEELKEYLLTLKVNLNKDLGSPYIKQFIQPINPEDIISNDVNISEVEIGEIYFLNFNYTKTLSELVEITSNKMEDFDINSIHGSIENKEPIVFGYGDEMDEDYKKIEDLKNNDFLKHIKSFQYLLTLNEGRLLLYYNGLIIITINGKITDGAI